MKLSHIFAISVIALGSTSASAATLNLNLTADNAFNVYISTDNTVLGTLIGSGSVWQTTYTFSAPLVSNSKYFIQVIGTNVGTASSSNPDAFIGSFSITGGGYQFANGGTSLSTDTTHWLGYAASDNTTWTTPTTPVQSFATNGGGIWGSAKPGAEANISSSAEWIWSNPDNGQFADLSTEITATPLPASWTIEVVPVV